MADFEALVTMMFEMVGHVIGMATIDWANDRQTGRTSEQYWKTNA